MNIKELMDTEELINNIVEDLDELSEDVEVFYSVWALGHDTDNEPTDDEVLVGEFTDPDEAITFAESVTVELIKEMSFGDPCANTAFFTIEVETVVADPDDEDGGTMNIGTIYVRDLWITEKYEVDEMSDESVEVDPIIAITAEDYELLEDGALKVRCDLLKGFNKNDYLRLQFVGEPESVPVLTYKIISKVIYEDGDYYHLEFEY